MKPSGNYNIERELIELCKSIILKNAGFDNKHTLTNKDLEYLCFVIEEKSKITLSSSTLRRIWKNEYNRIPQESTLDAIAQFIDFNNWNAFKQNAIEKNLLQQDFHSKNVFSLTQRKKLVLYGLLLAIVVILTLLFFFVKFFNREINQSDTYDNVIFRSYGTISTGVPNTVVFEYNIDGIEADSFFIQPSWDVKNRQRIYKNDYYQTILYYYPDYHVAKLIANNKVIKEHEVFVNTDGWIPYITYGYFNEQPIYLKTEPKASKDVMSISLEELQQNQIELNKNWIIHYRNTGAFKSIDSDNFTFKTRVKLKDEPFKSCPLFYMMVNCMHASFDFPLIKKGCENSVWIKFSDFDISGEQSDLSSVGCELNVWHELVLKNVDKNVTVFLNDRKIYQNSYTKPGGIIAGFDLFFNCIGEVDYVMLYDKNNQLIYDDWFERVELN